MKINLSGFTEKLKKNKLAFLMGVCIFALGGLIGYLGGGGMVTPMSSDEVALEQEEDSYQYIPKDTSIEDALSSGHYTHCIAYSGIGLKFSGKDNNGDLIVGQSVLTYPANKAQIFAGTKVSTPLEVLRGDLGSPVKVEFKQGLTTKSEILARVMMKKCWKKTKADSVVDGWEY